jgi:Bacterial regulatory protein, Fis family
MARTALVAAMTPSAQAAALARDLASEREARRRLEALWTLMPLVASTLDIREIFQRVSAITKEVIPHDALGIQLNQPERDMIVAYVVSVSADLPGTTWEYPILKAVDETDADIFIDDSWFEDAPLLAETFLADLEKTLGRHCAGLSPEARNNLLDYDWPGNIRELGNALERAVILCDGGYITEEELPLPSARKAAQGSTPEEESGSLPEGVNLEVMEKALIEKALTRARYNKSKAARLLGLTRAQLYFRLEKYGLADPEP